MNHKKKNYFDLHKVHGWSLKALINFEYVNCYDDGRISSKITYTKILISSNFGVLKNDTSKQNLSYQNLICNALNKNFTASEGRGPLMQKSSGSGS